MKKKCKFYLVKVGKYIFSHQGFQYDFYNTEIHELQMWCGWYSLEELYSFCIEHEISTYTILSVTTTNIVEEV